MSDRPRVFVARRIPDEGLQPHPRRDRRRRLGGELPPPRDELLRRVAGVDGVLALLTDKVDDELLDAPARSSRSSATTRSASTTSTSRPHAARRRGRQHARRPDRHDRRPRVHAADGGRPAHRRGRPTTSAPAAGRRGGRCCCSAGRLRRDARASWASGGSGRRWRGARGLRHDSPVPRRQPRRRRRSRRRCGATFVPLDDAARARATSCRST